MEKEQKRGETDHRAEAGDTKRLRGGSTLRWYWNRAIRDARLIQFERHGAQV